MVRQSIFEKRKGGQFIFEEDDLMEVQCMEHDAESVMRMTCCPSADYVLEICYAWIDEEIGGVA